MLVTVFRSRLRPENTDEFEHVEAMQIGRERFYAESASHVSEPARESLFRR